MILRPSEADWAHYDAYHLHGRSATKAAAALDCGKDELVRGMRRVDDFLRVSGWREAFADAIKAGFSQADSRDMADQKSEFRIRQLNGE